MDRCATGICTDKNATEESNHFDMAKQVLDFAILEKLDRLKMSACSMGHFFRQAATQHTVQVWPSPASRCKILAVQVWNIGCLKLEP